MIDREKAKEKIRVTEVLIGDNEKYLDALTNIYIDSCIPELEQNFNEWIEDKPFSDVVIGDEWTVNKIFENYKTTFLEVLKATRIYKVSGFKDESFVYMFYNY
jgi:hypothetical protein